MGAMAAEPSGCPGADRDDRLARARRLPSGDDLRTARSLSAGSTTIDIPQLGFGVWQVPDADVDARSTDRPRGRLPQHRHRGRLRERGRRRPGARRTDVPREDIFVTTKVWNDDQGSTPRCAPSTPRRSGSATTTSTST